MVGLLVSLSLIWSSAFLLLVVLVVRCFAGENSDLKAGGMSSMAAIWRNLIGIVGYCCYGSNRGDSWRVVTGSDSYSCLFHEGNDEC